MTERPGDEPSTSPPSGELKSKRFGRREQRWVAFRDGMLSRHPESIVDPAPAAPIVDLHVESDSDRLSLTRPQSRGSVEN